MPQSTSFDSEISISLLNRVFRSYLCCTGEARSMRQAAALVVMTSFVGEWPSGD